MARSRSAIRSRIEVSAIAKSGPWAPKSRAWPAPAANSAAMQAIIAAGRAMPAPPSSARTGIGQPAARMSDRSKSPIAA